MGEEGEKTPMKHLLRLVILALLFSLILSACTPAAPTENTNESAQENEAAGGGEEATAEAPTGEAPSGGEAVTLTIDFTTSQTGSLNLASVRQQNGLNLWLDSVKELSGLQVGGQTVNFETVS